MPTPLMPTVQPALKVTRLSSGCTFGSQVVIVPPGPLNTRLAIWLGSAIWPIWSSVRMSK